MTALAAAAFGAIAIGAALLTGWGLFSEAAARRCWDGCTCRTWQGDITGALHAETIARSDASAARTARAIAGSQETLAAGPPTRKRRRRAR